MLCFFSRPFFLSCTTQKNRGCCYATDSSELYSGCCCCYIDHRRVHKKKGQGLVDNSERSAVDRAASLGSSFLRAIKNGGAKDKYLTDTHSSILEPDLDLTLGKL